ncbi:MAG: HD domain-containing protein [Endomicrobiales bacterium]|nr:HD domain-containing protein [Endomicrobiales bacterium]
MKQNQKELLPVGRNFKSDLEKAARQMILVRRVDTLARLIVRTIMRNIPVRHAGILLLDKNSGEYIVKISRGKKGIKVPVGFTKVKLDNPLIKYFTDKNLKSIKQDFLLYNNVHYLQKKYGGRKAGEMRKYLEDLKNEFSYYQAKAFVPGFYRHNLIGVLFIGEKINKTAFRKDELGFLSVLASDVVMAMQNAWLFEDLNKQLEINKRLFLNTVIALATAIEAKDKYTKGHTERVVRYSIEIARNLDTADVGDMRVFEDNLRTAALMHDIGKIGIPEKVLNKKKPLSMKEKESIKQHPMMGVEILNPINEFKDVLLGVKYHHERYDGRGYPFKLSGEKIPLAASIIAVADAFDAMTTDRPYRKALTLAEAVEEIRRNRGKQFHPRVVDAFLKVFQKRASMGMMAKQEPVEPVKAQEQANNATFNV